MAQALGFLFLLSLLVTGVLNYTAFSIGQDAFNQTFEQPQYAAAGEELLLTTVK